jgi:hypothetical protein
VDTNIVNPVKRATRRYFIEFGVSMAAYVVVIFVSRWLLRGPLQHASDGWQIAIALLPIVPTLFVFAAIVRVLRGIDELSRQVCVDSLAIAGGATALMAVTYGLIEGGRFPYLSAWWTYTTFMTAWLVATFFVRRRYR